MMKPFRETIFYVLLGLLGLAVAGLYVTSGWINPALRPSSSGANTFPRVDQSQLNTAQNLSALAVTPAEHFFASEALRLADQEVDQAFASALRELAANPIPLTPKARQLQSRVQEALARVNADQEEVDRLSKLGENAKPGEDLQRPLQLANSRLTLDQVELDDARRDLTQDGGNALSTLQRLLAEHERLPQHIRAHGAPATPGAEDAADPAQQAAGSLVAQLRIWIQTRAKHQQLFQAQQDAVSRQAALTSLHNSLQQKLKSETAGSDANQNAGSVAPSRGVSSSIWVDLGKRMETERKLADVYARWDAIAQNGAAISLHRAIQSAFWILLILILMLAADRIVRYVRWGIASEAVRLLTLRSILHFCTRAIGLLLIAFVIFGRPSQLATVLGLVGAGLTVALKDFIVSFFGWFMLMGRNGMRRGDWVEINGVQGKVIQVGLLHTVILETGNWTGAGHPTGRKVTFVNSFPIEGHYFNFTTAGQWLWDEVQVELRSGVNPYPIVESIQKIVVAETESNVKLAEAEWQRVTSTSGMHPLSGVPSISARPTVSGVNLVVRYITRADERENLQSRLYVAICDLLIGKNALATAEKTPK